MTTSRKVWMKGSIAVLFLPAVAHAHVSVGAPGVANTTQEVTFSVGHGCSGADTYAVTIDIPAGVTSVRPMRSDFGTPSVQKNASGVVTSVTWQKPLADALPADTSYYKLVIRMKLPNLPFTQLYFPTHQTCRDGNGNIQTVDWVGTPQSGDAGAGDASAPEPAPSVTILPARQLGWNKYSVPVHIADLSVFFKDAAVVWKQSAAYSSNPNTLAQIKAEAGVTELTALHPGDEVWVKY